MFFITGLWSVRAVKNHRKLVFAGAGSVLAHVLLKSDFCGSLSGKQAPQCNRGLGGHFCQKKLRENVFSYCVGVSDMKGAMTVDGTAVVARQPLTSKRQTKRNYYQVTRRI